jgi:hypothetical protein
MIFANSSMNMLEEGSHWQPRLFVAASPLDFLVYFTSGLYQKELDSTRRVREHATSAPREAVCLQWQRRPLVGAYGLDSA